MDFYNSPSYSCNIEKKLDVHMQFAVAVSLKDYKTKTEQLYLQLCRCKLGFHFPRLISCFYEIKIFFPRSAPFAFSLMQRF